MRALALLLLAAAAAWPAPVAAANQKNGSAPRKGADAGKEGGGAKASPGQLEKDLKEIVSGHNPGRTFALRRLAEYPAPVPERQAEVAAALMAAIEKTGDGYNEMRALAVWATPAELEKVPKYIGRGAMTKAAIYTLGKKKATAAAKQVAACLADGGGDGKALVQALIEIGPACEEHVLPFLAEENRAAARRALQVLAEVGGQKSVEPVRTLTTSKKADLVMPAKLTLARIEERLSTKKDRE